MRGPTCSLRLRVPCGAAEKHGSAIDVAGSRCNAERPELGLSSLMGGFAPAASGSLPTPVPSREIVAERGVILLFFCLRHLLQCAAAAASDRGNTTESTPHSEAVFRNGTAVARELPAAADSTRSSERTRPSSFRLCYDAAIIGPATHRSGGLASRSCRWQATLTIVRAPPPRSAVSDFHALIVVAAPARISSAARDKRDGSFHPLTYLTEVWWLHGS